VHEWKLADSACVSWN